MLNIAVQRLHNQHLDQTRLKTPNEVVAWLGAVQSQDYAGAKWALGLRLQGAVDSDIDRAFNEGSILRTHVMRPTWHFVTPADIRWILELTAPRVHAFNAYYYRQLEIDDAVVDRSNEAIIKALQGGNQLTREELGDALALVGIEATGIRLGYIIHHAELDCLVCSGPRRGKQFTYMLLDERAPQARRLPRDEALAELTRRYFTSHAPATVQDFAWWSGLTIADTKHGLEMLKSEIVSEEINGKTYWFAASQQVVTKVSHSSYLLPNYDEYTVAYKDRSDIGDEKYADRFDARKYSVLAHTIIMDSQVVGTWQRRFKKGEAVIESIPFYAFSPDETDAFAQAANRYGQFIEMPVVLA
jgi:hypothetical protein